MVVSQHQICPTYEVGSLIPILIHRSLEIKQRQMVRMVSYKHMDDLKPKGGLLQRMVQQM